jgi:predicted RNase H-related nuclease YkuK (DUF458 family)
MRTLDIEEVVTYINAQSDETKVYIGVDSERVKDNDVWYVDYLLCVVVHIDGRHGCKVFGGIKREKDFDKNLAKPRMRLVTEAYKAAELYLTIQEQVAHDISIHLDINPDELFGSSCAISEAMGYIKGVCGITPKVKPNAWAASIAADRIKSIR